MTAIERLTAALADRYRIERVLGARGMATVYLVANGARLAYSVYSAAANIWSLRIPEAPPVSGPAAVVERFRWAYSR